MDIRNILYKKQENKMVIFGNIIIWLIISSFVIGIIVFMNKNKTNDISHELGEQLSISGVILLDDNYPTNTHIIQNEDENIGLRNGVINLNNFVGDSAIIDGKIIKNSSKYPIINMESLRILPYKLIVSENRFFFTDSLISFDFSKETSIYAKEEKGQIVVFYEDKPMIYINTFVCNKIAPSHDCEQMKINYAKNLNEVFTTYLGHVFYKGDNNSWVTFNDDNLGYIFTTTDDDFLLDISHLINIIDSSFLIKNKRDFLKSICVDGNIKMDNISDLSKSIVDENLVKISLTGTDTNGSNILCKFNVDIFNNREVKNLIINNID